jgi:DNA-binding protein HU-beta
VAKNRVIKLDIVKAVASASGLSQSQAETAVEEVLGSLKIALVQAKRVEIRGFGVFSVRPLKRGIARNPKTGEITPIPQGHRTVRFKAGKYLQNLPCDDAATPEPSAK